MRVIEAVRRPGVTIEAQRTIREAAATMEQNGVGSLAVVDGGRLAGIVTDRDIVRRALATGRELDARIDSVMTTPAVTIAADADLRDVYALFRTNPVRRLCVVRNETFVGMVTVDDMLVNLYGDLRDLARPVAAEVFFAHHDSPVPTRV